MQLYDGVNLYVDKIDKLKTTTINLYIHEELSDNASKFAILPAILKHGCEGYPTYKDVARYLEDLYGASLRISIGKKGERQIVQFIIEFIDDVYVKENLMKNCIEFIYRLLTQPLLSDGSFKKEYVDIEKANQINQIESLINDKSSYAVEKCLKEMCGGERFAIDRLGSIDSTNKINGKDLYDYYLDVLKSNPIDIFVTGNVDEKSVYDLFTGIFKLNRGTVKAIRPTEIKYDVADVKHITEKLDVVQGKLTMGYRTGVQPDSDDYYKLTVFNGILGGGVHSKLFKNVREKASLAYYAFSRLEKFKALMIIASGIDVKNFESAVNIINEQIQDINNGKISEYEYSSTLKSIENSLKSAADSAAQRADFMLNQILTGSNLDFNGYINKIKSVTTDDVIDISKKVKLDTVYFLRNNREVK